MTSYLRRRSPRFHSTEDRRAHESQKTQQLHEKIQRALHDIANKTTHDGEALFSINDDVSIQLVPRKAI
ncbi:MAG: hypothetical protein HYR92_05460 [Burkholderiales bacterium]|nr:hypothetical protein [Burkholderiales bacterium]